MVAKGTLRNAVVKAHPVAANGTVDTATALAETLSNDQGRYELKFSATAMQPYVIRVTPRPAGQTPATTQLDEITGETPVPADFALRALFVPATATVSTSASVTPFSELAVAAAEKGTGGVTPANATQATVNVTALLGFNPTEVQPATIAEAKAAGNAQQLSLAALLTAVSRLANDGGLGCAQAALADRTRCVTAALSASATLASTKPGTVGGTDVAAALASALQQVVADNQLAPAVVAVVVDNLQGRGTPPPANIAADTQAGIAAARTLFTSLRSDLNSLFAGSANGTPSAALAEAQKFQAALKGVQAPAELLLKNASALISGIDLYRDFIAGRSTLASRSGGSAEDLVANGNANVSDVGGRFATSCALFTDSSHTVLATTPAQAKSIGCVADYYVQRAWADGGMSSTLTRWQHGFTITPGPGSDTRFTYVTGARQSVETCSSGTAGCAETANNALQAGSHDGSIEVTPDTQQRIVGFTFQGGLAGAFAAGGTSLVSDRHAWSGIGSRTPGAERGDSSGTFSATVTAFAAGSTTPLGVLKVIDAKTTEVAVSRTAGGITVPRGDPRAVSNHGGETATVDLPLTWVTPAVSFAGRLALTDSRWDASKTVHVPTKALLEGRFSNVAGGAANEFLSGSFTVTGTGYGSFDETRPRSAANKFDAGFQFSGTVTAPQRPALALTIATSAVVDRSDPEPLSLTAQYRTLVNNAPTLTANISATRTAAGGPVTVALTEATSNVSLHWVDTANTATLRRGTASNGTELGTLTIDKRLLTFVDGSTISLEFGL